LIAIRGYMRNNLAHLTKLVAVATIAFAGLLAPKAQADCTYSISPTNKVHGKGSSSGTITVTLSSAEGCEWTAYSSNSWLKITSVSSGVTGGTVKYDIDSNPDTTLRRGLLNIAGETYYVLQWGSSCEYIISPTYHDKCYTYATGSVNITTHSTCDWETVNTNDWVQITQGMSGTGGGKVYYNVLANLSANIRTGVVMIAGQSLTLVQAGIPYSCASNKTVQCGQAWSFDPPMDKSPGQNDVIQELSTATNVTGNTTVATRTWSVKDRCGNGFTCSQTVTIVSSTPPTLACASNKSVEFGQPWSFDTPTPSDSNLPISIVATVTNISETCAHNFEVTRTWRVTDQCGASSSCNQTITVMDTTPPQFTACLDKTVPYGSAWSFDNPSVVDIGDGGSIVPLVLSTITNTSGFCGRSYSVTRTWRATDQCANSATCNQTVNVMDTAAPTLQLSKSKIVECGTAWSFDPPTSSNLNISISTLTTVTNDSEFCSHTFEVTRTWRVIDQCGNGTNCSQTLTVMDTTAPEFICSNDKTVQFGSDWSFDVPSVYDMCDGTNVPVQIVSTFTNTSGFCGRSCVVTRTWRATDECGNSASCMQSVFVTDITPPALASLPDQTIPEGTRLSFTVTPANTNEPGRSLVFSLDPSAPEGASIDPITGLFSWTPTEAQGPGTYQIIIWVTDACISTLTSSRTANVTVLEVNAAPVLDPIDQQTVMEGTLLTFKVTATDVDLPAQTLGYSLGAGAPAGAHIDPLLGVFTWTPTEAQGPSTNTVTIRVTDNGSPSATAGQTFTIVVLEANSPPVLAPIGDKSVNVGSPLTFRVSATDPDLPAQTLSYSLDPNAPTGATINPSTGVFTWTPPPGQTSTVYNVTVIVCDDGTPSLCAQQTFFTTVGGVANLVVSSRGTPNPAVINCNYSYTVTVSNEGPETAFAVMLTNYLPASASFVSSYPGGSFSPECAGWTFYLGDLPPGWTTNVTVVALPTALGTMTNLAVAGSATPEIDFTDNTTVLVTTVEQGVHLDITSPTNGSVLLAPFNIPITTSSADPNSTIQKVEFFVGDLKIGECFAAPYGMVWTNPPPGHYLLTARALDKDGKALCATTVTIDVVPGVAISDGLVTEDNATSVDVLFPVRLSVSSTQTVSVDFDTSDGTALAGWDYVPMHGTVVFPPGVTNRTIRIPIFGDTLSETNEAFFVQLSNPTNGLILVGQGIGTIRDNNDPFPRIHICDVVIAEGNQGTSTAMFVVQLSTVSGRTVTVNYSTAPGTASNNVDFLPVKGVLTFPPGTLQQSIEVPIVGDLLDENDETFFVNLSAPTNGVIMHAQGLGTIVDDDLTPTLSIGNATVTEGNSGTTNAVFQVLLSAASGKTITVRYATASGSATTGRDFVPASGVLTFTPGMTSKSISVGVRGDTLSESNEFFFVNLSKPLNSAISQSQGIGTILDDDSLPILSVNDIVVPEGGIARFTVRLSAASGRTVLVQYGTTDGTAQAGLDYRGTNGFLVFPPGTTARTIAVPIIPDSLSEDNETFLVYLLNAVNATLAKNRGQATIQDNDPLPVAYVNDSSVKEGNFGNPIVDFNVRLSAPSAKPISISYHLTPGSARENVDYLPASGTLVFLSGMTNLTIPVAVIGDLLSESNETFYVNLSAPVNATIGRGRAKGTILDDDGDVWISINNVSVTEPDTTRTNAQFTVSLSAPSGKTVVVCYNTLNGSALAGKDYLGISGVLTFPPGVTNLSLFVPVLGDTLSESNETFFVRLYAPVNAKIATPLGRGTILDNNDPVPSLSINDISVGESGFGVFTIRLSAMSGQTITVNYSTADGTATAGSDYSPTSGTVVFAPGIMSRTVSVAILPDTLSESNETFFVNLGNPVNANLLKPQGKGTIIDNDQLPSLTINDITGFEGSSAIFTVHLSAQSGKTVTVNYATANGTALAGVHYASTSGILTFAPGTMDLPLSVTLLNDGITGTSNRFVLNLSGAANAGIADSQGVCTIFQNRAAAPKSATAKSEKDLKITWVKVLGTNVLVSFPTLLGRNHLLEYNEQSVSASNAWQPVEGAANLLGTGNSITAIHIGGASRTNCFYRVRVQP
jgi:uncharacterized repeat protein (TIGR01451 family)